MRRDRKQLNAIGLRFKHLREELKVPRDRMAGQLGTSLSNYYKYEYGEVFPGLNVLTSLAVNLNVSLDWLIANKGPMFYDEKTKLQENAAFERVKGEVGEILAHMQQIPLLRYEILSFYHKFKLDHKDLLESPAKDTKTRENQ